LSLFSPYLLMSANLPNSLRERARIPGLSSSLEPFPPLPPLSVCSRCSFFFFEYVKAPVNLIPHPRWTPPPPVEYPRSNASKLPPVTTLAFLPCLRSSLSWSVQNPRRQGPRATSAMISRLRSVFFLGGPLDTMDLAESDPLPLAFTFYFLLDGRALRITSLYDFCSFSP